MKILIFSDSHGYNVSMACAVEREAPDMVLHLGDHTDDAHELEHVCSAADRVRGARQ